MSQRLAERLARHRDAGAAIVLACHDAGFLRTVADDVLLLDDEACRRLDPTAAVDVLPAL